MAAPNDLERFRQHLGMSVTEMARQTGVERSRLARILSGDTATPRTDAYFAIVAWAERVAKAQRLRAKDRLAWRPEAAA